jgi:tetratricopeptide (TPR) repeat protein
MFEGLKSRLAAGVLPRFQEWTSDRTQAQIEAEEYLDSGDYVHAEICLVRAIVDGEKRRQPAHRRIELRLELAEAQRNQATRGGEAQKLAAAEETAKEALELAIRSAEREMEVQCLDCLGAIYFDAGFIEPLEEVTHQAISIEATLSKPAPLFMARRLQRLGIMRKQVGRVGDAVATLEEVIKLFEQIHGPESLEIANQLTELGDAYRFLGAHAKAQKSLLRAQRIHIAICGVNSPEAVHDLSLLTASFEACGDLESAAAQHERVLGLKLREVGAGLEQVSQAQIDLAQWHLKWGNTSRSRELLMEAIATLRRTKGAPLAAAYEALAAIEENAGHHQDALKEMANAGRVWEGLGEHYLRELVRNLEYRAQLLERLHLSSDAAFLRNQIPSLCPPKPLAHAS